MRNDKISKIVIVGSGGVGKTCIASRLVTNEFIDTEMTKGLDVESWEVVDDTLNTSYKLVSIDLGGQQQFRFLHDALVQGACMAIVVFDVTRYESLLELEEWRDVVSTIPSSCCILVGNKTDLGSSIPEEEIANAERTWYSSCILVSSQTGENFDKLENRLLEMLRERYASHHLTGEVN